MSTSRIEKIALAELNTSLSSRGFKKRAGFIFTLELKNGIVGRFAATKYTPYPYESVVIMPLVGVRHTATEELIDRVLGRSRSLFSTTIQVALGQIVPWLGPGQQEWEFSIDPVSRETTIGDLVYCLDQVGIPFIRALDTPEAILVELEKDFDRPEYRYRRAVMKWSMDRAREAAEELRRLSGECYKHGSQLEYFSKAAANTLAILFDCSDNSNS